MDFAIKYRLSFGIILVGILFLPLFSCAGPTGVNAEFQKKYGKQIEKLREERASPAAAGQEVVNQNLPKATDWRDAGVSAPNTNSSYYAYMDIAKFNNQQQAPQEYLPNYQLYERARIASANNIPEDIFVIVYNTGLYPPFKKDGVEFDVIEIPEADAYGIKTALSDKPYLLSGNESLQKNIDQINDSRTQDDIKISEILIKEQKQLRRKQKIQKIFGESIELASLESSSPKKEIKKTAGKKDQNKAVINSAEVQNKTLVPSEIKNE